MESRVVQREDLIYSLGLLLDPIRRLISSGDDPRPQVPYLRWQFLQDEAIFHEKVRKFCTIRNTHFERECSNIFSAVRGFGVVLDMVNNPANWGTKAFEFYASQSRTIQTLIREVPCDDPDTILPAESPFQSYLRLRPIFAGVGTRLDLFDPYLDASVYHRYLAEVSNTVPIVVVTSQANMTDKRNARRRREMVAVSELFAKERPTAYRLLVSSALHDRHLRADSTIYHLGGSIKDAGAKAPFALSKQSSAETDASLDGIIAGAVEWFGAATKTHRRR